MNPKVLIVSQNGSFRENVEPEFLRRGFKLNFATTAIQGLHLARGSLPDVIVLDELWSDLDGPSLCGILRTQLSTRDIPVILLDGPCVAPAPLAEAVAAAADLHQLQPFDLYPLPDVA